jgi:hypothetical protein
MAEHSAAGKAGEWDGLMVVAKVGLMELSKVAAWAVCWAAATVDRTVARKDFGSVVYLAGPKAGPKVARMAAYSAALWATRKAARWAAGTVAYSAV